jgi:predicted O-methyltransferase YrrM
MKSKGVIPTLRQIANSFAANPPAGGENATAAAPPPLEQPKTESANEEALRVARREVQEIWQRSHNIIGGWMAENAVLRDRLKAAGISPIVAQEDSPIHDVAARDYEFAVDWFSQNQGAWRILFQHMMSGVRKVLEIGAYEGRSTVWLTENGFLPHRAGELYCIDTWEEGLVEAHFDHNIATAQAKAPGVTIHKIKSDSLSALSKLIAEGHRSSFDFIYVDGSHICPDVLADLVLAFALCRVGGFMLCDDYVLGIGENPLRSPKLAIDSFVNCYSAKVAPDAAFPVLQLLLRKRAE